MADCTQYHHSACARSVYPKLSPQLIMQSIICVQMSLRRAHC